MKFPKQKTVVNRRPSQSQEEKDYFASFTGLSRSHMRMLIKKRIMTKVDFDKKQKNASKSKKLVECTNEEQYTCPICLEIMIYPISLICGHHICLPCIEMISDKQQSPECPICRQPNELKFYEINSTISKMIEQIRDQQMNLQEQTQYNSRKIRFRNLQSERGEKYPLYKHLQIQVKQKDKWVSATVVNIISKDNQKIYEIVTNVERETLYLREGSFNIKTNSLYAPPRSEPNIFLDEINPLLDNQDYAYDFEDLIEIPDIQQAHKSNRWNDQPELIEIDIQRHYRSGDFFMLGDQNYE